MASIMMSNHPQVFLFALLRQKRSPKRIHCQFPQLSITQPEDFLPQLILAVQRSQEHLRIIGVERDHQPTLQKPSQRMLPDLGAAAGVEITREADLDGDLQL